MVGNAVSPSIPRFLFNVFRMRMQEVIAGILQYEAFPLVFLPSTRAVMAPSVCRGKDYYLASLRYLIR